jgi:hypothetical protein
VPFLPEIHPRLNSLIIRPTQKNSPRRSKTTQKISQPTQPKPKRNPSNLEINQINRKTKIHITNSTTAKKIFALPAIDVVSTIHFRKLNEREMETDDKRK